MTGHFPYRDAGAPPIPRPIVALHATHGDRTSRVDALLDTGSPLSVFDRRIVDRLGVRLGRKGAEQAALLLYGGMWTLQFEYVDLALDSGEAWTARVGFVAQEGLRMPFSGILGSDGFFDRYVVTFAEYHGWVAVEHAANVPPV